MKSKLAIGVIIVLLLVALFSLFQNPDTRAPVGVISFSQFLREVDQGRVHRAIIQEAEIQILFANSSMAATHAPPYPQLVQRLVEKNVEILVKPPAPWPLVLLVSWLPFMILAGAIVSIGRSLSKILTAPDGRHIAELMSEYASESKRLNEKIERLTSDYERRLAAIEEGHRP